MKRIGPVVLLLLAACGGGGETVSSGEPDVPSADTTTTAQSSATTDGSATSSTEPSNGDPTTGQGAGITLVIGDETWTFERALCAFYDAPAGDPGSRWNVSAIMNGSFTDPDVQVYVNWEDPDTYLELNDFETGEGWSAQKDTLTIEVAGNDITATATFADDAGATAEGNLSATCESWVDAG